MISSNKTQRDMKSSAQISCFCYNELNHSTRLPRRTAQEVCNYFQSVARRSHTPLLTAVMLKFCQQYKLDKRIISVVCCLQFAPIVKSVGCFFLLLLFLPPPSLHVFICCCCRVQVFNKNLKQRSNRTKS